MRAIRRLSDWIPGCGERLGERQRIARSADGGIELWGFKGTLKPHS
jgi:hypothetical protein